MRQCLIYTKLLIEQNDHSPLMVRVKGLFPQAMRIFSAIWSHPTRLPWTNHKFWTHFMVYQGLHRTGVNSWVVFISIWGKGKSSCMLCGHMKVIHSKENYRGPQHIPWCAEYSPSSYRFVNPILRQYKWWQESGALLLVQVVESAEVCTVLEAGVAR